MKTIVALPGEGIGIEVVEATCEVLEGAGLGLKILHPPQGAAAMKEHGTPIPEETKRAAREADGVLFGAAGPSSSAVVSWLRWEMDAYAGVRPVRFFPGMHSPLAEPDGIDYVILRENSQDLYPGREGDLEALARVMPDLADKTGRTIGHFGVCLDCFAISARFAIADATGQSSTQHLLLMAATIRSLAGRSEKTQLSCS